MNLKDYQEFTKTTWIDIQDMKTQLNHAMAGVGAEAGEVLGCYQKYYRGDYEEDELHNRLYGEIGGLMYYICMLCNLEGFDLEDILRDNSEKLKQRVINGTIQGDGDNR